MNAPTVRVAIVGCGAVAELHLAALRVTKGVQVSALYDTDTGRAERLRRQSGPHARVVRSLAEAGERADLAIVATPAAAHAEATCELLERGLHVLCEKPLATSPEAARAMIETAAERGRLLACGLVRRFHPNAALLLEALDGGLLGTLAQVEIRESVSWPWSRASFDPRASGGGVLLDTGPHALDLPSRVLGPLTLLSCQDDRAGGVEAHVRLELRGQVTGRAVPVDAHFGRGEWGCSYSRWVGEKGEARLEPHSPGALRLRLHGERGSIETVSLRSGPDAYVAQLRNVVGSILGQETLGVPGAEALPALEVIQAAYRERRPLTRPWDHPASVPAALDIPPGRILVTGATGRIGSRLIEMWAESGRLNRVRCLVRSYRGAARLMRHQVEVVEGDLRDPSSARAAVDGCEAVVHLGAGDKPGEETRHLATAAIAGGVRRFVHMSTAVVYGLGLPDFVERLQEDTPLRRTGEIYADGKAAAEREIDRAVPAGLGAVILRPQVVYGPEMRWSAELLRLLAAGRLSVVSDGGTCNLIYVDDLVRAVERALSADSRPGARYFVTDGRPRAWADYIEAHARLLGARVPRHPYAELMPPQGGFAAAWRETTRRARAVIATSEFRAFVTEAPLLRDTVFRTYLALRERSEAVAALARAVRQTSMRVDDEGPGYDRHWLAIQLSRARLSSEKAAQGLGFTATVDFEDGLRRTAEWSVAEGLLPATALGAS